MLSTEFHPEQKRKSASCYKCKKLNKTCHPDVRRKILHPEVICCDYAKWGCEKYEGEGKYDYNHPIDVITEFISSGKEFSVKTVAEQLQIDTQQFYRNLSRMRKSGVPIVRERRGQIMYYRLQTT